MAIKKVVPLTAPRETLVESNAEQFSHWCFHPTVVGGVPVELQWVSHFLSPRAFVILGHIYHLALVPGFSQGLLIYPLVPVEYLFI